MVTTDDAGRGLVCPGGRTTRVSLLWELKKGPENQGGRERLLPAWPPPRSQAFPGS